MIIIIVIILGFKPIYYILHQSISLALLVSHFFSPGNAIFNIYDLMSAIITLYYFYYPINVNNSKRKITRRKKKKKHEYEWHTHKKRSQAIKKQKIISHNPSSTHILINITIITTTKKPSAKCLYVPSQNSTAHIITCYYTVISSSKAEATMPYHT